MKKKLLFSIILAGGLIFGGFSGYQVYGQTPTQNKTVKQQTGKYTCPMHSEVIKDKPGKCPKCGMELVVKMDKKKSGMMGDSAVMKKDNTKMMRDTSSMKRDHMMNDTTSVNHKKMGK